MEVMQLFGQADAIGRAVALLLLLMSVSSWIVILWKAWLLQRAAGDVGRATAAFWQSPSLTDAQQRVAGFDREALVLPLIEATQAQPPGSLAAAGDRSQQLTRVLRDALHAVLNGLSRGQVVLATIGATAPFVGLFGTVWGIYHALLSISSTGNFSLDKVAGPVGEALIMTAAGLAVAIPAVLAYNLFGKWVAACEAELEGFAHDLRELVGGA